MSEKPVSDEEMIATARSHGWDPPIRLRNLQGKIIPTYALEALKVAVLAERRVKELERLLTEAMDRNVDRHARIAELERELAGVAADRGDQVRRKRETRAILTARAEAAEAKLAEANAVIDGYGRKEPPIVTGALDAQAEAERRMYAMRDERDAAEAKLASVMERVGEAYEALHETSHYAHFDRQGTAGANCPACLAAIRVRDGLRSALAVPWIGGEEPKP